MSDDIKNDVVIGGISPRQRLVTHPRVLRMLDRLPKDGSADVQLISEGTKWILKFAFASLSCAISVTAHGSTPENALTAAEEMVWKQIHEWRQVRFKGEFYDGTRELAVPPRRLANVLIVDDDVDTALEMQMIFSQFGCRTRIVTDTSEAERLLSLGDADIIVLDWMLEPDVHADQIVERSAKLIDAFDDLKELFSENKPKVVTYSGLQQIAFPKTCYFDHLEHWQKPANYAELKEKAASLLRANGF